ncbi:putative glycoprotein-receptor [Serratia fonticola AU-AP2C]|nr:putative glycoprotein-receptor [Serratia fonticola AU-AP2C]
MNTKHRLLLALSLTTVMATGSAQAAGLMDSLSSAATELSKSGGSISSGGMSLSSLSGLLNGGDKALSSSSMTNAAGILQYCVQNNVLSANGTEAVKDQLLNKLGITSTANANSEDYQQGLGGLLLTGKGNTLDLNSLGTSQITEKVKQKACDLVLKQGMSFIS